MIEGDRRAQPFSFIWKTEVGISAMHRDAVRFPGTLAGDVEGLGERVEVGAMALDGEAGKIMGVGAGNTTTRAGVPTDAVASDGNLCIVGARFVMTGVGFDDVCSVGARAGVE